MLVAMVFRSVDRPTPQAWFGYERAWFCDDLVQSEARDLVIVSYSDDSWPHHEWVYNGADIDGQDIVWARDMGEDKNRRLFQHFRDRKIWLMRVEALGTLPKLALVHVPEGLRKPR
jgi:hypothetical protein